MKTLTDIPIGTLEEIGDILDLMYPFPDTDEKQISTEAGRLKVVKDFGKREVVRAFRDAVKYQIEQQEVKHNGR